MNEQYNAAVLYLEKKAYKLKESTARVILFTIGLFALSILFYFLKFIVAL